MSHLSRLYDPLIDYPDIAELLRLRVLFALDAQRSAFSESGSWRKGIIAHFEYPAAVDETEDLRSTLRQRYESIEFNQPVQVNLDTQFGRNLALLKERLALDEVECCIFTAFAFADQDALLVNLLQNYLPTVRWTTFRKWWAQFCGLSESQVEDCLGPNGSLIKMKLFTVDWSSNLSIEQMIGCMSNLASAIFNQDHEFISSVGEHFGRVKLDQTLSLENFRHVTADLDIAIPYIRSALKAKLVGSNVLIYGSSGTGKTELARVLAKQAGADLFEIKSVSLDGAPIQESERMRRLRFSQYLLARSNNTVLMFDSADDCLDCAPCNDNSLTDILESNCIPTIWVASSTKGVNPAILRRFDIVLHLDKPPVEYLEQMLKDAIAENGNEKIEISMLAAQLDLTPAMIRRVHRVLDLSQSNSPPDLAKPIVNLCIKSHVEVLGGRIDTTLGESLIDLAYDVHASTTSCNLADLTENLTKVGGGRICLYGPPGTGKTAFARHLAHRLGKKLKVAPASTVLSRYIGDSEKAIARIFAHASLQDAVLFFDEVDSLLIDRAGAKHSWEISQVNELLCQMEQFNGVMIAATNQFDILDAAVMRRFDLKVKFDWLHPDQAEQLLISSMHTLKVNLTTNAVARLRTLKQLAPGDFALVLRQAKFQPISSCDSFVERLEAENRLKTNHNRSIGFV